MTGPSVESKVAIFVEILSGAAALLGNPNLGIAGAGKVVALIGYAGNIVRDIAQGADKLHAVNDQIKRVVSEDRVPNDAEWLALDNRLDALDVGFTSI